MLWDVGTAQCHVDEQRHTFLRLPKINPQIGIKYVEDRVGVSLIFLCVASLFCVGVSTLVCPGLTSPIPISKPNITFQSTSRNIYIYRALPTTSYQDFNIKRLTTRLPTNYISTPI